MSLLAIVHIPDRRRLCARMACALRPGGGCFIEDLCMRAPFAPEGVRDLHEVVHASMISTMADYVADLQAGGFVDVAATDLTPDWAPFAAERLQVWRAGREAYARVHGQGAYAAQELFHAAIVRLYESGSLGGIRLVGHVR